MTNASRGLFTGQIGGKREVSSEMPSSLEVRREWCQTLSTDFVGEYIRV